MNSKLFNYALQDNIYFEIKEKPVTLDLQIVSFSTKVFMLHFIY